MGKGEGRCGKRRRTLWEKAKNPAGKDGDVRDGLFSCWNCDVRRSAMASVRMSCFLFVKVNTLPGTAASSARWVLFAARMDDVFHLGVIPVLVARRKEAVRAEVAVFIHDRSFKINMYCRS